ncbi:MAG: FtsW/RodA/SpoVE family cell cycle protein, partial [Acidimicrobiales bacterium]
MSAVAVLRRRSSRRRTEAGLLVVGAVVVLFATLLESLALTGALPDHIVEFIVLLALIAIGVQGVNRIYAPNADPVIMPVVLLLNGIGYVFIERGDPAQAGQQLAWTLIGLFIYTAVLSSVRYSRDLDRYRYLILAAAFLLLISPLLPGIGLKVNGARLWVHAASFEFQPVEIAKLLLVIFFASYFIDKRELLTVPTRRIGNRLLLDLRAFGPIAIAAVMALMIILVEDDIGFSLILFVVFLTMIWMATGRWSYVLIGLAGFALVAFLASHILTQVNERFTDWLNPWPYPHGIGDQPIQGELAFARGGLFGTGIGFGLAARPDVLPISSSDYIFAIIGEEIGLVGALGIVACFAVLVGAG